MIQLQGVDPIRGWLDSVGGLSEALLDELSLTDSGYSLRVVFKMVVDLNGAVLSVPTIAAFGFEGLEELRMHGALTSRMIERPEGISWGLSEVALVRASSAAGGAYFEILWEGDRRIEIECHRASLAVNSV
jgi:hypothetical protein